MTGLSQEGYARLPEDLLRDMLAGTDGVVETVTNLLAPALEKRSELRAALEELKLVRRYEVVPQGTISGIDGGFAVERTAAIDLILSVAVGVEGLTTDTTVWENTQYEWWNRVENHDPDAERLARGVMIAQELAILTKAPHAIKILDGSHLTLVIQLNSALSSASDNVRAEARTVWERLGTAAALAKTCTDASIIAMPKYDSSRTIAEQLAKHLDTDVPGDDKYLMSLLLEPGELIIPHPVPKAPWTTLHFTPGGPGASIDEAVAKSFTNAIEPLKQRKLAFTYFKPDEFSPAFRIEMKAMNDDNINLVCSTIAGQITGPFVREPYPQYLADVMAKSVGLGLTALQSAVQLGLGAIGKPEIARYLIHSYRTEGI
jgi:hypothetical protein